MSSGDQPDLQLAESSGGRLLPFPFPAVEPPVEVVDLPGEIVSVRCVDARAHYDCLPDIVLSDGPG